MSPFCAVALVLALNVSCDVKYFPHYGGSLYRPHHLFLQPLQHGSQQSLPVLLDGLHLLLQFFLGVLDEVVILLKGLLDHPALVLPLLCEVLQQLGLLALEREKEHWPRSNRRAPNVTRWQKEKKSKHVRWLPWKPSTASLTFRRSSAASSFFWISSREGSRRCGMEVLSSGTPSKDGGLRMTSKAWPEARLFSSITSTSLMTHQPRSTASVVLDCDDQDEGQCPPPPPRMWFSLDVEALRVLPSALYVGFSRVCGFRQEQKRDTRGSSLTFSL